MVIHFKAKNDLLNKKIPCYEKLNLLGHAQIEELSLGSECGGHGVCGKDKIQIIHTDQKKINPPTEEELKLFSKEEIQEGWRLSCQCFPNQNDLEITVSCPVLKVTS